MRSASFVFLTGNAVLLLFGVSDSDRIVVLNFNGFHEKSDEYRNKNFLGAVFHEA